MQTMMTKPAKHGQWYQRSCTGLLIGWMVAAMAVTAFAAEGVSTGTGAEGPAQTAYAPANGAPGPVIITISGQTGPTSYQYYAAALAQLGYYAVLLDGKDILIAPVHKGTTNFTGSDTLRKAIERAQHSPNAIPGKVAVIGFSLGGGGALYHATTMPDLVAMVVAYYPFTRSWANDMDSLVKRFRVPVLVMAGGADHYHDCCVVESMQAMAAAAKASGVQFELVIYPEANHGFNLKTGAQGEPGHAYRPGDALDAWHHTVGMLKQYHPLN